MDITPSLESVLAAALGIILVTAQLLELYVLLGPVSPNHSSVCYKTDMHEDTPFVVPLKILSPLRSVQRFYIVYQKCFTDYPGLCECLKVQSKGFEVPKPDLNALTSKIASSISHGDALIP